MNLRPFFFSLMLLYPALFLFGQRSNCDYENYMYLSDRAIIEWNEGQKHAAVKHLREALSLPVFPRGKHVAMALKWAVEIEDHAWSSKLAFQLVKAGVPMVYFGKYDTQPWFVNFAAQASDSVVAGKRLFNFELRGLLLELRKKDSIFTDNYHLWMNCAHQATLDEMILGAEGIQNDFIELIKAHGFPSEKRMGYYFQEGEVSDFPVLVIMIHIYQRGNLLLNEQLPELVCDGALTKVEMAVLKDNRGFGNSTGCRQEMNIRAGRRKCQ